jgi:CRP-like cAMP-binding protein
MSQSKNLHQDMMTYAQAFFVQASYTALANGRARLDARLARWLVMAHDRLDGDRLPLTHEFLAVMLGVRRPGVSIELQKFAAMGLIETERSAVTIKNRKALEVAADGFYGIPETEQERLTGWRPPHRYTPS